jgi:ribose 5-phosphate isomerase B
MKIAVGSDHRGYLLKEAMKKHLHKSQHECVDVGTSSQERVDYPDFAVQVAELVGMNRCSRGILVCGSGIGMSMVANKHKHVRAALCTTSRMAELSRKHNDANVLCLGAENQSEAEAMQMVDTWLKTEFEGGRHSIRLEKIRRMEGL